jgi:hypothetical protein
MEVSMESQNEVLSRKEAAQYLHICLTLLDRTTDIPRSKIGKRVLFQKAKLDEWLSEHSSQDERK